MNKFSIGQKVVPVSKTIGEPLPESTGWNTAKKKGQPFLYVTNIELGSNYLCWHDTNRNTGDYFRECDLIPYEESRDLVELAEALVALDQKKKEIIEEMKEVLSHYE